MFTLSERTLGYLRDRTQKFMIDKVTLSRPTAAAFDITTGQLNAPSQATLYQGKARISPSSGPQTMVLGEELIAYRQDSVYLPWDCPAPRRDDLITVVESNDAELQGRVLRIVDVEVATNSVSRKCTTTATEQSRSWM